MPRIARFFAVLAASILLATTAQAQTLFGTVEGTIVDEQGAVMPGVTVTLSGPQGAQTAVTDEKGGYRLVGVQPGSYALKVELSSFATQQRDVALGIGKTATVDFTMKLQGLTEAVEVRGSAATVDVKSSATDTTVSNNMLQLTPLYSSTSSTLLNAAPGINSSSAFGSQGTYGNALLLDGVDTRDPEGGSAWTFFNQNMIEEIQIGGLGAPAEYGGFTGAIINTVTKSGGNAFSGLFSMRYTDKALASNNVDSSVLQLNPALGEAAVLKSLKDYTVQMGGPLKRNKAFFFASVQRYSALSDPSGPVANNNEISPRVNVKLTLQPTAADNVTLSTQYDNYNINGRTGFWGSAQTTDQQTVNEDAPEWVWNAQWRHVFGSSSLLEAKWTGYGGYYYLDPVDPSPFTFDGESGTFLSGGGGGQYYADRSRNQYQATMTKYADKYGSHSFKFGAEIERSHVRSQYQPYGPAGFYSYQYGGVPYYRVSYGYDLQGDNHRTSAFAQDQWTVGNRLTMNLGVRLDHIRGISPVLDQTVYTPNNSWGPRLGASYNLGKGDSAVIRAFWGRYYEGAASSFYTSATPGIQDLTHTPLDENGNVAGPPEVVTPAQVYGIGNDINHPRTDEFNVSYEQQLMRNMRFTVSGIWRHGGNFINNVINDARFAPVTLNNPLTNQPLTAYSWINQATSDTSFFIRNTSGFQYLDAAGNVIATADPRRSYKGLMLLLSNGLRGNIGYQLSYVLSKAEGNVDNSGEGAYVGNSSWDGPSTSIVNAFGELTNSRRHEIKAYFTYKVPVIDVMLGGNYTGLSGRPYTPFAIFTASTLDVPGSARRTVFLEPRGSRVNDFTHQVDLRVEKAFKVQTNRFGVYADIANLFNAAGVLSRQGRVPSSAGVLFGDPTALQGARQVTFGARWMF